MRSLSPVALAKLQNRFGNEPVVIVEIQWIRDGGWIAYADRNIQDIVKGKILELSDLDDVVAISDNNDSQEIQVTFDDVDGSIKAILDTTDIHQRDVRVWQWFEGLSLNDRFLLFRGKINSPIIWNEGEQTVSFSIISQIEDKEFGFSPEEGQFPYIPVDLVGKVWPSCFGTPLDVPSVAIGEAIHGTTCSGVGIISGSGFYNGYGVTADDVQASDSIAMMGIQARHVSFVASSWIGVSDAVYQKYNDQLSQLHASMAKTTGARQQAKREQATSASRAIAAACAKGLGASALRILGGQLFPRACTLIIGGGLFSGYFGSRVGIDDNIFYITSRYHVENAQAYNDEVAQAGKMEVISGQGGGEFSFVSAVPCGSGDFGDPCHYRTEGTNVGIGVQVCSGETVVPKHFWADAGSQVTVYGPEPITYIISIVPGTVVSVKAFKIFEGIKHLVNVPNNYYRVENKIYGSISAVQLVLNKTLSTIPDQNWSDDLYVTFHSSVGPNIVEILEYIIDTYTEFSIDTESFDYVRDKLEPFPANFAVLDRKNVLTVLQEIAYQARCSLRLINGIFYLTYLPEEPVSIDTIIESDVEVNSITVSGTPTEDLVTKMVVEWRITYAKDKLNQLILRNNIGYYGLHEESTEFYIYNQPDIILKAATFWLIRKSNTWKLFNFRTFLQKLNVETLDCITLNFEKPYVSSTAVKSIVKKASFNSADQLINMECWLPIKFGTMVSYNFAWPADTSPQWIYPTDYEVDWDHPGGDGIGMDAQGNLPVRVTQDTLGSEIQFLSGGGSSTSRIRHEEDRRNHDVGDRHPSDKNFIAQDVGNAGQTGIVDATSNPIPGGIMAPVNKPIPIPQQIPLVNDGVVLDLCYTKVRSEKQGSGMLSFLSDVLKFNTGGDKLCLKDDLWVTDGSNEKEFDFKFDEDGAIWGAGTAWLKPE